jgi:mRNA-degrading endonuclease RelE of RelBE toxin-antitoxin system
VKAAGDLDRLQSDLHQRILEKLNEAVRDPMHYCQRLVGREQYKLRIGAYRAIVEFRGDILLVLTIGHRSTVYRYSP